jgi:PadR family transcriptional regulator, regulatory protein PadR
MAKEPKMTRQTLQILSALVEDPEREWYGLELSGRSGLKTGSIYPILGRLLESGWLERHWEDVDPAAEGRPRRRLYRLTRVGERSARLALDEHLASLGLAPTPAPRPTGRLGLA